ncbi:MAG: hypothetical protein M9939_00685 [Mesorhizobium sp.]|nr:hypothetical protein [Mesorhizobium sp.]MCO5159623.1 hypothetical protein [Mesorhizobium sp.]
MDPRPHHAAQYEGRLMASVRTFLHAMNVGVHDSTALTRIDLERMRLAAETQTNFMAKATGPGFMRPGLEYLFTTTGVSWLKEFVFGATDASNMLFSDEEMRIVVDDALLTRPAVTATVSSGTFAASAGWTLSATDGATATISGGYLNLTAAARGSTATATQTVAINETDTEHAFRIVVERGPVLFRCGSSSGGEQYITETSLKTGIHSLSFTPTGANAYIQFKNDDRMLRRVDSIAIESAGVVSIATPWASDDLPLMRFAQSADVVFVACEGHQPRRIERRAARSWSVVLYGPDDGPFTAERTRKVKLKPSVTEGNGTLTADGNFFNANHVGALFKLFHEGQSTQVVLGAAGQFTDPIRVTGVYQPSTGALDRQWTYEVAGTFVADIWNQRSFDAEDSGYVDYRQSSGGVVLAPITAPTGGAVTQVDQDQNAIIYYRLGIKDGGYTSGSATITITYSGGGGDGICRVVGYTSPTQVDIEVLTPFKNTTYTDDWQEGEWSANRTYPSAVCLADGRLWWSGSDKLWGSISDAFEGFDEDLEGDAGPINRSIATGGVNATQWLMSLQRLIAGTEGAVAVAKSSSLDEPITPSNLSIRNSSTTGAAPVNPAMIDTRGLFIERAGRAVMEVVFDGAAGDYVVTQLSKLTTDLFSSGVKSLAVQRRPDTRIWLVMDDGSCVCCLYEPAQEVLAFIPIETDGTFESVSVLPAEEQDRVYFVVARTIGGSTVRYVEKMALDSEVAPDTYCYVMDSFVRPQGVGSPSTTVSVGAHLAGETVVCWADGAPLESAPGVRRTFVVDGSGNITVPSAVTDAVAGLPYRARYKSARLAYGATGGSALLQKKHVSQIGPIMTNFTRFGVKFGADFTTMYAPPVNVGGVAASEIQTSIVDEVAFSFGGYWDTDSRVCLEINSPYTATVMGIITDVTTNG